MAFSQNWFKVGKTLKDAGATVTHPRPGRDLGRLGAAGGKAVMFAAGAAALGTAATDLGLLQPAAAPASGTAAAHHAVPAAAGKLASTGGMISTEAAILSTAPAGSTLASVAAPAGFFAGPGGGMAGGAAAADLGTKAAAKSGIMGTGVSTMDTLSAASTLSALAAPSMPRMPSPIGAPNRDDLDMPENRTEQMKLREDARGRRARAAGAQRSENSADMLGGRYGPRRRGQAREALYGLR